MFTHDNTISKRVLAQALTPTVSQRDEGAKDLGDCLLRFTEENDMTDVCTHLDQIKEVTPSANGCEDCLRIGASWVHLRLCMTCGHVGCCDSSPNKHATKHFRATGHPIIKSFQPGEDWGWCFVDEVMFDQL